MISDKDDNNKRLVVLAMAQNTSHLTLLLVGGYYKIDFHLDFIFQCNFANLLPVCMHTYCQFWLVYLNI